MKRSEVLGALGEISGDLQVIVNPDSTLLNDDVVDKVDNGFIHFDLSQRTYYDDYYCYRLPKANGTVLEMSVVGSRDPGKNRPQIFFGSKKY